MALVGHYDNEAEVDMMTYRELIVKQGNKPHPVKS